MIMSVILGVLGGVVAGAIAAVVIIWVSLVNNVKKWW
ncbi:hypothetical protein SEA_MORRIGAN_5 [Microbacterium phage Morrigan]|nr:hypothetical protein SEA_MORRIGAN_5 [Microbacterium phage Morrigan]